MRHHAVSDSAKSGAPIAQVLNDAESNQNAVDSSSSTQMPQAAPFSGKLVDLLLDTPEQLPPSERRWADHQYEEHSRDNPVIKLPQLPQLPAKTTERARIPPLLQGLHQPPPLPPSGRLFPPITDGASGFEQDIRDRIHSANASQEARSKRDLESAQTRSAELSNIHEKHGENDKDEQDGVPASSLGHISDQEATSPVADLDEENEPSATAKKTRSRKRRKWTDEETRDLLLGVSRFGIGKWKRILNCPDYKFSGRTAVDLKDRFRVCCPGEGLKSKKSKQRQPSAEPSARAEEGFATEAVPSSAETGSNEVSVSKKRPSEETGNVERRSHPKLVELGIHTPFAPSTRRSRQTFSTQDDENLLKGFEKYGAFWHLMRDDKELGFGSRHPTDLRDRFRIRYPEEFARAGYTDRRKSKLGKKRDTGDRSKVTTPRKKPQKIPSKPDKERVNEELPPDINDNEVPDRSVSKASASRPSLAYAPYFPDPNNSIFLNDSNPPIDKDGTFSPIILNRNILQWADANTFLMTSPSSNSYNTASSHDMSMHINFPNDGIHIDPMATLKLPLMAVTNHNQYQNQYQHLPQHHNHNVASNNTTTQTYSPTSNPPSRTVSSSYLDAPNPYPQSSSKSSSDHHLLRTPNLPTIVFPHVPTASARGMVHNLPTPADLLSGMDLDGGGEGGGGGDGGGGYGEQR
jgi:hypothetical protein